MSRLLLFPLSFLIWSHCLSQPERVAQSDEITWFGMDFSKTVIVGATAGTEDAIVDRYFQWWNTLVIRESSKYDVKKFFRKSEVTFDLAYVTRINAERDRESLFAYNEQQISEEDLSAHIRSYEVDGTGVGLVYVIENFNAGSELGTAWVVFFDINSKSVLLAKRVSGEGSGFTGFRNFWARSIYNMMISSQKQYKKWVK